MQQANPFVPPRAAQSIHLAGVHMHARCCLACSLYSAQPRLQYDPMLAACPSHIHHVTTCQTYTGNRAMNTSQTPQNKKTFTKLNLVL